MGIFPIVRRVAALLLLCLLCGCKVTAYSALTEREVNDMLVVLANNGIAAEKISLDKGLWELSVDERYLPRSLDILAAYGLPRAKFQSMGEVFRKDGMVSTPVEEEARLIYALSQELAGTVAAIDGVLDARVHLVLPEVDNFGKKLSPSTAAIFIRHRSDTDLSSQVSQIKHLVANSVRDLKYEAISVYLFASTSPPPAPVLPEVEVFGIAVDPSNANTARILAAALLLLLAAACFLAVLRVLKTRGKKTG